MANIIGFDKCVCILMDCFMSSQIVLFYTFVANIAFFGVVGMGERNWGGVLYAFDICVFSNFGDFCDNF